MDPVQRAIWFVEGHLTDDIGLGDVAEVAGLSRHHMVRAFSQVTGRPVMRYVRARRLSEAARALAAGAPDILSVALEAGYGSHEAFTRAFRDQFGTTPEQVRAAGCVTRLALVEPMELHDGAPVTLAEPEYVDRGPLLLAGLVEPYRAGDMAGVTNQWRRFLPWLGHIPGQTAFVAYGVICNDDDEGNVDYLTALEVRDFADLPPELARLRVPARRYAVFRHPGHVSEILSVWRTLWTQWVPGRVRRPCDAPFFERYPEAFDPQTGEGGYEIWLPVEV